MALFYLKVLSSILVFVGAVVVSLCAFVTTETESSDGNGHKSWFANVLGFVARRRRLITFISAVVIALGGLGNIILSDISSRATSSAQSAEIQALKGEVQKQSWNIDSLRNDNDSLRAVLKPIAEMAKFSGMSVQQEIDSLYSERKAEVAQSRLRQAKLAVTDFRTMLSTYDTRFREKSLDSISADFASRGLLHSGIYIKAVADFAVETRRKRDISIDSALMQLERLGVNTDTLRFSRRLPVRIGELLKGLSESQGIEYSRIRSIRYDTL